MGRHLSRERCSGCEIRPALCFCAEIPRLELKTRVVILMHHAELWLSTNTARLAHKALVNSEIRVRGKRDEPMRSEGLVVTGRETLFLFPSDEATELTPEFVTGLAGPVTLIVPDGSWRQARKVAAREPALAGVRHVKLPFGAPSIYRLRTEPNENSLCTFEAIARALGVLEGGLPPGVAVTALATASAEPVQARLEGLLRLMVERTLWSRGVIAASECVEAGGIPSEAIFHGRAPSRRGASLRGK